MNKPLTARDEGFSRIRTWDYSSGSGDREALTLSQAYLKGRNHTNWVQKEFPKASHIHSSPRARKVNEVSDYVQKASLSAGSGGIIEILVRWPYLESVIWLAVASSALLNLLSGLFNSDFPMTSLVVLFGSVPWAILTFKKVFRARNN